MVNHAPDFIKHDGIVQEVHQNYVKVNFTNHSACSGCHAQGICGASDSKEKTVDILDFSGQFSIGEHVTIFLKQSLGFRALFIGYIFPFLAIIVSLITCSMLGLGELKTGLISLGLLIPYYLAVYFSRGKLEKTFHFSIQKNN